MRDPFAAALAVLHTSAASSEAVYTPVAGSPVTIRVIRGQGTKEAAFGQGSVLMDVNGVQIRRSDLIGRPDAGAGLSIITRDDAGAIVAVEEFTIQGGAMLDVEGVTWNCELEAS